MKENPFTSFWLLLVVSFLVFLSYSFADPFISLPFKRSRLADFFRSDTSVLPYDQVVVVEEESISPVMDSTAQSILLIGDSMLEGLSPPFLRYATQNGHTFNAVLWYSSSTKYFGECDTLSAFIKKYEPTFILLSLGTNELFIRDIQKERAVFVKRILSQIDSTPYVWIGPPNWKEDTGINELILRNTGYGRYFESKRLDFERTKDGAHPTFPSAAKWVDSIACWIMAASAHPILLEKPDSALVCNGNGIREILKPLR